MSVYFAQVGPYIKVGFSENPERRVRRLFASATRYGAPAGTPLDGASRHLIRHIPGDLVDEALIHQALDDFAVGSEWFADEPEVRDFIAAVEPGGPYWKVDRPDGPIPHYDETRDLNPDELALLRQALNRMFAPSP